MKNLIAVRPLRYATRQLRAGEHFSTKTERDARILIATGRAKLDEARAKAHLPPPPVEIVEKVRSAVVSKPTSPETMEELRARYHEVFGKRPFMGWDAETLKRKIVEHEG